MENEMKILLIGPYPPGWGGARVSFKLFYDYINMNTDQCILYYDAPTRFNQNSNTPGHVNHLKTSFMVLSALLQTPFVSKVIIFGSRHFCFSYGLCFVLIGKLFRKPVYIRFFGGHPAKNAVLNSPLIGLIAAKILARADQIIVQTYIGAEEFPKFMQSKISTIVGYRPAIKQTEIIKVHSDRKIKFLYTGDISRRKGVGLLLNAFVEIDKQSEKNREAELHLYGSGEKELIDRCSSLKNVFHHGRIENEKLRSKLSSYDVFVFPSQCLSEGHPGSVIEALMAGLPVIATSLTGINEVLRNNINGLLVQPNDIDQLIEAMKTLLADPALRERLSENAIESSEQFDAAYVLPKLAEALGIKV